MGAINSEGELPLDVATEDAMERLLKAEIKKQGGILPWILRKCKNNRSICLLCRKTILDLHQFHFLMLNVKSIFDF